LRTLLWGKVLRTLLWGKVLRTLLWGKVLRTLLWGKVLRTLRWGKVLRTLLWGKVLRTLLWGKVLRTCWARYCWTCSCVLPCCVGRVSPLCGMWACGEVRTRVLVRLAEASALVSLDGDRNAELSSANKSFAERRVSGALESCAFRSPSEASALVSLGLCGNRLRGGQIGDKVRDLSPSGQGDKSLSLRVTQCDRFPAQEGNRCLGSSRCPLAARAWRSRAPGAVRMPSCRRRPRWCGRRLAAHGPAGSARGRRSLNGWSRALAGGRRRQLHPAVNTAGRSPLAAVCFGRPSRPSESAIRVGHPSRLSESAIRVAIGVTVDPADMTSLSPRSGSSLSGSGQLRPGGLRAGRAGRAGRVTSGSSRRPRCRSSRGGPRPVHAMCVTASEMREIS
jgi:hypothetical protein